MNLSRDNLRPRATLRELEVFRAIIDCGKTTAAAQQLGISQPAVSRTLGQLEARRGGALFRREGNRLAPTAEALALYQEMAPVFSALRRLASGSRVANPGTPLRIFAPVTLAQYFLPGLLADFLRTELGGAVQLEIGSTPQVIANVADGHAELGLTSSTISHVGVRLEPFRRAVACCVVPAGHRLAGKNVIRPADLRGEPFIALARRFLSRSTIDRIFEEARVARRIVAETGTAMSAVGLVRAGLGVSIVNPFPVFSHEERSVVFRRFVPEVVHQSSFVLPAATAKPEARRFVDFAKSKQKADRFSAPIG